MYQRKWRLVASVAASAIGNSDQASGAFFDRFVGEFIEASLIDPLPELGTRKRFKGLLRSVEDQSFTLELCDLSPEGAVLPLGQTVCLPWEQCRKVSKVHIFAQPAKPGKAPKQPKPEKKTTKKEQ